MFLQHFPVRDNNIKPEGTMKTDCRTKTIFCFIFVIIVLGGTLFIIYPPVVNSVRKINAFEKGAVFLDLGQQYWFGDGKKQDYALAVFRLCRQ